MSSLRDEMLAAEDKAWKALNAAVGALGDEDWERPGCVGDWTPKDALAHVACWTAEAARQLECIRAGLPSKGPDVEEFNLASYEACKNLSVREVKAMAASAHHRLLEELEVVAPVALSGKIMEMVRECGHEHSEEHRAHIDAFVEERG